MKNFNVNTANNDEWLTPPEILRVLGPFDLDPAAPVVRPWDMAVRHYTKLDDGMAQPWTANAPSCLVSYSTSDTARLQSANAKNLLKGRLILLR